MPFPEMVQDLVSLPAAGDVRKVRLVGQGGHDLVPAESGILGDALWLLAERGEKQHPTARCVGGKKRFENLLKHDIGMPAWIPLWAVNFQTQIA